MNNWLTFPLFWCIFSLFHRFTSKKLMRNPMILCIGLLNFCFQISLGQIAISVYSYFKVKSLLELLLSKPFLHADFSPLGTLYRNLTTLSAFNIFVAWIKIFKYLSFNKTMTQLSGTLSAVRSYIPICLVIKLQCFILWSIHTF